MDRYVVPRNIKVKEMVAYGLNGKQIIYMTLGLGGAVALWTAGLPSFGIAEKLAGSIACVGGGLGLSLAKVKGQELDRYVLNTIKYPLRTKEFEGGFEDATTKKKVVYTIRASTT